VEHDLTLLDKPVGGLMKKLLFVFLCAYALSLGLSVGAGAAELDFDDLSGTLTPLPDGYSGYSWSNFTYLDATASQYAKSGYSAGVVSINNVVYNSQARDASIVADAPFTFSGAYFTAAWNNGLHIEISGYRSGMLVGSDEIVVSAYAPMWYAPNWSGGVDQLTFHSYGGTGVASYSGFGKHFAMDNLRVAPVPLPPAALLLAPGLIGIAVIRRRRIGRR